MTRDAKLVLVYAIIVAAMTTAYATYQDLGLVNHAKATPAAAQVEADDE
jgi:cell division protein FtsL